MNSIVDLRSWAGVDNQDALLRQIEAGVIALVESVSNRLYPCPIEVATEILDGPEQHSGGLSQDEPGPMQWVTLSEPPVAALSGTYTVAAGGTTVTGTSSAALTELSADPDSAITFDGEDPVLVESITSDTAFELQTAITDGVTAVTAEAAIISIQTRPEGSAIWTGLDPRDFEIKDRRVYSLKSDLYFGRRTVRVVYRRGFAEGDGPADAVLLVLQMVKSFYEQKTGGGEESVNIDGGFEIKWAKLGEQAKVFIDQAEGLRRPFTFR